MLFNPRLIVRASVVAVLLNLVAPVFAQTAVPTLSSPLPAVALAANGGTGTVDLGAHFTLPGVSGPLMRFDTSLGAFVVELFPNEAPRHAENFAAYVQAGRYTNTMIHRSASLDGGTTPSIVQGGGYSATIPPNTVAKFAPIPLEYNRVNSRGTLAAARTADINSATSEWYFNTRDNTTVLGPSNGGGYTVFGRVIGTGMTVVDQIAALPRFNAGSPFTDLPLRNYTSGDIQIANFMTINQVRAIGIQPTTTLLGAISYTAVSANPGVATVDAVEGRTLRLRAVGAGGTVVTVTARDVNGNQTTGTVAVTVAGGLAITRQPESATVAPGGGVTLLVEAAAEAALSYQWSKDGATLPGRTGAELALTGLAAADSGDYRVTVTAGGASVTSAAATLLVATPQPGRLINLAVRSRAGAGAPLIVGFVVTGAEKSFLLRGVGPSLGAFGVSGVLADPLLELHQDVNGVDTIPASNDNWAQGGVAALTEAFGRVGAFGFTGTDSLDAALIATVSGQRTAHIVAPAGTAGEALVELYDLGEGNTSRLVNVSARNRVVGDSELLTAGFVINGNVPKRLLIRGIGPRLAEFGVAGALSDPRLKIFRGDEVVAENDNWGGSGELAAAFAATGAFGLPDVASNDAALIVTLPPVNGGYTAQISGAPGTAGDALVEVYELP